MNNAQQGISRTSKILSRILAAGCVLSGLAAALFVIGIGLLTYANANTKRSLQNAFNILTPVGNIDTPSVQNLTILFTFAILQLVLFCILFFILYRIFATISAKSTPFEALQVTRLKRVALLALILCVSTTMIDSIGHFLLYGAVTLKSNLMWFIIAIVIYCLSRIFEYGTQLQKQSDETL